MFKPARVEEPVDAVRRLFVDQLTPSQLDAIGEAAEIVLAALDDPGSRSR